MTAAALRILGQATTLTAGACFAQRALCTKKPTDSKMWFATQLILIQAVLKGAVSLAARKWTSLCGLLPLPAIALTAVALATIAYCRDVNIANLFPKSERDDTAPLDTTVTATKAYQALVSRKDYIIEQLEGQTTIQGVLAALQPEDNPDLLPVSKEMLGIAKDLIWIISSSYLKRPSGVKESCTVNNFAKPDNFFEFLKWANTEYISRSDLSCIKTFYEKIAANENVKQKEGILFQGFYALAQAMKSQETNLDFPTNMHALFKRAFAEGFTNPNSEGMRGIKEQTALEPRSAVDSLLGLIEIEKIMST